MAGRRRQPPDRQPRPPGRGDVPDAGRRRQPRRGASRAGPRVPRSGAVTSRVERHPEVLGEFPVVALAEEIETPGDGQVRALITVAGNPVLSTPNGARLDAALAIARLHGVVDPYLNETTRHADVILPPPSPLQTQPLRPRALQLRGAQRRQLLAARCCRSTTASPTSGRSCAGSRDRVRALGADADLDALDDAVIAGPWPRGGRERARRRWRSDADELLAELSATGRGPERLLDLMLRTGPYGDGFGANPDGASLASCSTTRTASTWAARAAASPRCCAPRRAGSSCAPELLVDDVARLRRVTGRRGRSGDGARRPPPPAVEQLLDAQRRGAGEGQATAARCRSTPTTPPAGARRRRGRARVHVPGRRR